MTWSLLVSAQEVVECGSLPDVRVHASSRSQPVEPSQQLLWHCAPCPPPAAASSCLWVSYFLLSRAWESSSKTKVFIASILHCRLCPRNAALGLRLQPKSTGSSRSSLTLPSTNHPIGHINLLENHQTCLKCKRNVPTYVPCSRLWGKRRLVGKSAGGLQCTLWTLPGSRHVS